MMKSIVLITLIFSIVGFFRSIDGLNCNVNNPCQLGGYYSTEKGYLCIPLNANQALCTCPNGGFELDRPCRVCSRSNAADNACQQVSNLLSCLETRDYGTDYVCLCMSPSGVAVATLSPVCDLASTLVPTVPTLPPTLATISVPATTTAPQCANGGVFVDGACQCPSGFNPPLCNDKNDGAVCDRIVCKNGGVCAIRNPTGPYQAVCLCRFATYGEYCEMNGTLGYCTTGLCTNGACEEQVIGTTRHAYCRCRAGYRGIKCEQLYFTCTAVGNAVDDYLGEQGKYFKCSLVNGVYRLEQMSCPKGLRYNRIKDRCTYP